MGRAIRQKINKQTEDLDIFDTIDQLNPVDTCRTLHLRETEYMFFSSADGIFSMIAYVLGFSEGQRPVPGTWELLYVGDYYYHHHTVNVSGS